MAFGQTVCGQMVFRSYGLSINWYSAKWRLGNRLFGQNAFVQKKIGEIIFRQSDPEPMESRFITIFALRPFKPSHDKFESQELEFYLQKCIFLGKCPGQGLDS
jgi:hypothetical protein